MFLVIVNPDFRLPGDMTTSWPYQIGHIFKDQHHGHITSIDFDRKDSSKMIACSPDDGKIGVYDALRPQYLKSVALEDFQPKLVRFTHHSASILVGSGKSGSITFASIHDNSILSTFEHNNQSNGITSLAISPLNDNFYSTTDKSFSIWDLRSNKVLGNLNPGKPLHNALCAVDPQGQVFALGSENRFLRLYDTRNYDKGPFASFEIVDSYRPDVIWSDINFSPDGTELLISAGSTAVAYVIDSFEGQVKASLKGNFSCGLTYSSLNRFIVGGCQDGTLSVWERRDTGFECLNIVEGHHRHVSAIAFNPHYNLFVSGCTFLALWIPGDEKD
jgi:WD40 repeat protein